MNRKHFVLAALFAALVAAPAAAQPKSSVAPSTTPKPATTAVDEPDWAYAEYQRGNYVTAFRHAMRRVEEKSDPKAMTLLGELYADGLGVAERR